MSTTIQEENATLEAVKAAPRGYVGPGGLRRYQDVNPWLVRGVVVVAFLAFWEWGARQMNPIFMAAPTAIAAAFVEMLRSGELLRALAQSIQALVAGYALAAIVGIPLGLLMGRYRIIEYALDVFVNAFYAIPLVAFIPLIMLWVGLGVTAKIVVVFLLAVFPILINTYIGVRNVSRELVEVGEAFCANEREIFTKIVIPDTVPFIMAGLRLAVGRALIGMVVAEFFTALSGLGAIIVTSANFFRTDKLFVPIIVLAVMGIGLTELVGWLERRVAPWKETQRT
ncbi:MAG: ABC transporter permease [Chloroflexi bacterium]|jgi:ABC-type nitrate/sulfonate/bicarbonate transport system permease component|nr:ABC transporter permease [Chloroflexota bacterium]